MDLTPENKAHGDAMTWGEFKKQVEDSGVRDDTEIEFIDTSGSYSGKIWVRYYPTGNTMFVAGDD